MEATPRKKRIPGTQPHINAIREINQELTKLATTFEEYRQKITEVLRKEKEQSKKAELLKRLEDANSKMRELKDERHKLFDSRKEITGTFGDIKSEVQAEKRKIKMGSTAEIDQRLQQLNLSIISDKLPKQKTTMIANEMSELKKKKHALNNLQKKDQIVMEMNTKLDAISGQVAALNQEIDSLKKTIDDIKSQLDLIAEQGKVKNPVVEKYEKNLDSLKVKKQGLIEQKRQQQEEIRKKEIEYDKYLDELSKQLALEKKKTELSNKIKALEAERVAFIDEQSKFDASRFDSVIYAIQNVRATEENVKLPIDLAVALSSFRINIPASRNEISKTIIVLEQRKEEFLKDAVVRSREIREKILSLEQSIAEEKKILDSMPLTDVRLTKEVRMKP